jgi:hypothetical protein
LVAYVGICSPYSISTVFSIKILAQLDATAESNYRFD